MKKLDEATKSKLLGTPTSCCRQDGIAGVSDTLDIGNNGTLLAYDTPGVRNAVHAALAGHPDVRKIEFKVLGGMGPLYKT